jgi:hypothetical protein
MPDFAIIPELPAGYPINDRRSVARLVSVQTVVVSSTPVVTVHAVEVWARPYIAVMDAVRAQPSDASSIGATAPSVSVQATETTSATVRGV